MPITKCVDCGVEFYTQTTGLRCPKCRPIHKKKRIQEANKRYHKKYYDNDENKSRRSEACKEYYQAHKEWYKEYQRKYYLKKTRLKRLFTSSTVEVAGNKITLYECPKLHFKAANLPCGDRYECWMKPKCQHIPKGKEPMECGETRDPRSWWQRSKIKPILEDADEISV